MALLRGKRLDFGVQIACHSPFDIGVKIADIPLALVAIIAMCASSQTDIWSIVPIAGIMPRMAVFECEVANFVVYESIRS